MYRSDFGRYHCLESVDYTVCIICSLSSRNLSMIGKKFLSHS